MNAPCPYVRSGGDGTHWCALAEQTAHDAREADRRARQEQSGPLPQASHSRDLPVTPAMQDYGHLAGDKPAPDHREAMRLALEAIEERYIGALRDKAIDALRAALGKAA